MALVILISVELYTSVKSIEPNSKPPVLIRTSIDMDCNGLTAESGRPVAKPRSTSPALGARFAANKTEALTLLLDTPVTVNETMA